MDDVLRLGGNTDELRMRVVAEFEKRRSIDEIAAFLPTVYRGGNGFTIDGVKYAVWYTEDGIRVAQGEQAQYERAQLIPWSDAAVRIGELLDAGRFATKGEVAGAEDYERELIAQKLWHLCRDLSEGNEGLLSSLADVWGGYPEAVQQIAAKLADPEGREAVLSDYLDFREAYKADPDVLYAHYHDVDGIFVSLAAQLLERRKFASDMERLPNAYGFITQDEIDKVLCRGGGRAGSKWRIFRYFTEEHSRSEKAAALKELYGTGGRGHAPSGASGSNESYDAKGIRLEKLGCEVVNLKWSAVARRIDELIASDRYMTETELAEYDLHTAAYAKYRDVKASNSDAIVLVEHSGSYYAYRPDAEEMKCRYMDELTGSRGIVFATGTPVSNSMTELYTMQRYLQHDTLERLGLGHFDSWAANFGETVTALELAPEGTGYRARTRFSKFFNLPELMNLFREVADIKTADQLMLPTPEVMYHNEVSQPTEIQKKLVQELSERATKVHARMVDPSEDNMLAITNDGRKLGLDQRVVNPLLPDEPGTKVNRCVDNVFRIWLEGADKKLTQLIFCDLSTPGKGFNIYDDIKKKLVARGVPENEIAFIHAADTDMKKKELFAKVRSGNVRVLIGSTAKMGAGTNVQDRLVALHDLDAPWRPGDLEQRKLSEGKGAGYERWAKVFNLKQMAQTINFLKENGNMDFDELSRRAEAASEKCSALTEKLKATEARMSEAEELKKHVINYLQTRETFRAYKDSGYSKRYLAEHEQEILLHRAAKKAFNDLGLKKLPTVKALRAEYAALLAEKRAAYPAYREARTEMKKLLTYRANAEAILGGKECIANTSSKYGHR